LDFALTPLQWSLQPLNEQLKYDPESGIILEIYQQPTGRSGTVAMQQNVDYAVCEYRTNTFGEKNNVSTRRQKSGQIA